VLNAERVTLVCQHCGQQFTLELPKYCAECYPGKRGQLRYLACSQCRSLIVGGSPIYCATCFGKERLKYKQNIKEYQDRTDELQSKLLLVESQTEHVTELLHRRELLVKELEQTIRDLNEEMERRNARLGT
jgi:hypothetical protein